MDRSFRHADTFPVIVRLIPGLPGDVMGFVGHDAIVTAILADPEGTELVAHARSTAALS